MAHLKFESKHNGNWAAVRGYKVVDYAKTFDALKKRLRTKGLTNKDVAYTFVPKFPRA